MPIESFKIPNDAVDLDAFLENKMMPTHEKCLPEIFFYLNMNPSADGSAYLEYGQITVCCSVNGPLEMKQEGQLVPGVKFAPFVRWLQHDQKIGMEKRLNQLLLSAIESSIMLHCFPRGKYEVAAIILDIGGGAVDSSNVGDCHASVYRDRQVERNSDRYFRTLDLRSAIIGSVQDLFALTTSKLHCFPRGKYEVAAIILDIGGGAVDSSNVGDCLAAAVTCAGLALLNAGVQMYDIPVGVNVDLSAVTATSQGRLCAAVLPKLRQFPMLFSSDTRIRDTADLRKALNHAMDTAHKEHETRSLSLGVEPNDGTHYLCPYFHCLG
ncbi:hypothetical protein AHF37_00170 [Paragonimus kellicotti]|nr:hypothetical protein AHF37_00170 [Paragonimus kellicotti]